MEPRPFIKDQSWKARWLCFRHAARGIAVHISTQANARIQGIAALLIAGLSWALGLSAMEWCAVVGAIGLVWVAEMFNTAIEFLVDFVSPNIHPLAGRIKDVAAGAVLVSSLTAAVIGAIIFLPKLLR